MSEENLLIQEIDVLIARDLSRLAKEVEQCPVEVLWKTEGDISNSIGTLTLHLCGNLRHFIGHVLGNSDYVRDREHEFNATDLSNDVLLKTIENTQAEVHAALFGLPAARLTENYPLEVFGSPMTTMHFLIHLQGHLNYHLGQVNYLRRVWL